MWSKLIKVRKAGSHMEDVQGKSTVLQISIMQSMTQRAKKHHVEPKTYIELETTVLLPDENKTEVLISQSY